MTTTVIEPITGAALALNVPRLVVAPAPIAATRTLDARATTFACMLALASMPAVGLVGGIAVGFIVGFIAKALGFTVNLSPISASVRQTPHSPTPRKAVIESIDPDSLKALALAKKIICAHKAAA